MQSRIEFTVASQQSKKCVLIFVLFEQVSFYVPFSSVLSPSIMIYWPGYSKEIFAALNGNSDADLLVLNCMAYLLKPILDFQNRAELITCHP